MQAQQQRPESPKVTLTWHAVHKLHQRYSLTWHSCKYKVHKLQQRYVLCTSGGVYVPVFTRMPGESYRRRFRSLLLCLCDVIRALINSFVCLRLYRVLRVTSRGEAGLLTQPRDLVCLSTKRLMKSRKQEDMVFPCNLLTM